MAETELSMDTRALMLIHDLANDAGVGRGCHSDGYFRFRAYQAKAREILGIEESHTKKKFTPEERLRGLRNLRRGYGSTSVAVGFWQKLHGEDLIEIYAETVETKRGNSKSYPKTWSDPPTFQKALGEPAAESVVRWHQFWREMRCFWAWPFGHRWEWPLNGGGSKECARCETWRQW